MTARRGQISVLVLLLSMLGLVVSLSVASRSLSDLRQVTYVDSGTRALAAAEAGLQYVFGNTATVIRDTTCDPTAPGYVAPHIISGLPLAGINSIAYNYCASTKNAVTMTNVARDDVIQVDLPNNANLKGVDVSWSGPGSIEIEVVDSDNSGNYFLRRYAYNPSSAVSGFVARGNGFASGLSGSVCNVGTDQSSGQNDCPDLAGVGFTSGSCTGVGEIARQYANPYGAGNLTAQSIRIRPLYQNADISFCGRAAGKSQVGLAVQYYTIVATATTGNNTVRRLQADYFAPAMPAVFDNVLYSGGNIAK